MARDPFFKHDSFLFQAVTSQYAEEISSVTQTLLCTPHVFSQPALNSSLLYASENGPSTLIQPLLIAGAYLESRNETGKTPLLLSVGGNQINATRLLLVRGANVNACDNVGDTALILSTYFSASPVTTKLLLETQKVNVDHRNTNGFTALACAMQAMNLEAMKLLIDANARVELPTCSEFVDLTFAFPMPTVVADVSRRNGIFNLIKLFKIEKDTGESAILQASAKRDSRSVHYITNIDNTILNYNSSIYLRSVIEILKTIHSRVVSVNEMNIIRVLINMYISLRKEPLDKLLEEQAMKLAINIGHTSIIRWLCDSRFFVSNKLLGIVAAGGNCLLLDTLVRHGANVCEINSEGQQLYPGSALETALLNEQFECAKMLLCCGAFLDLPFALKVAVESKKENRLQFFLRECPESRSELKSSNLLHLAVGESDLTISKMLLDNGADVNGLHGNKIPLMEVMDIECLDLLVSRGADVNMVIGSDISFRLVLHYFLNYQYKNYFFNKATMKGKDEVSIKKLHATMIKRLIFHGATVDGLDGMDRTPLMVASETMDSCEAITVLFEAGADVNKCRHDGATALHSAVQYSHEENVKCLLELGADINAGTDTGNSVLFICNEVDLLKTLIASNADVNTVDSDGDNAIMLHIKQWSGDTELIEALIEAKCDVNRRNQNGQTPLLLAANTLKPELLSLLLCSGADVNYALTEGGKNKSAASTIFKSLWTRRSRAVECLQVLLDHGLNITNIPPCIIHALISVGCFSVITKVISLGLPPVEMVVQRTITAWYKSECTISPLVAALLVDNVQATQFFVDIRYLTQKDLQLLFSGNKNAKSYFQSQGQSRCLEFLDKFSSQPMSLESLSLVAASEVFGSSPGRKDAIEKSGLPVPLQELILHEKMSTSLDDSDRRNMLLYKSALQNAHIIANGDRYFEMIDEYDSDFDSDSD